MKAVTDIQHIGQLRLYTNPFWNIYKNTGQEKRNRITALGSAKYQLTNWLSVQGRISCDRYDDVVTNRTANNSLGGLPCGSYSDYQNNVLERNLDVLLSGNNKLGKDFCCHTTWGQVKHTESILKLVVMQVV